MLRAGWPKLAALGFGRDSISSAPPAGARREGSVSAIPGWPYGTRGRHIASPLDWGRLFWPWHSERSWHLVLGSVPLGLCHIRNPPCKVFVSSVFSSVFYSMLLIHQCHPCQWFMNGRHSQAAVCVALETNGVVWVAPFLWSRFENNLPGTVGRSGPEKQASRTHSALVTFEHEENPQSSPGLSVRLQMSGRTGRPLHSTPRKQITVFSKHPGTALCPLRCSEASQPGRRCWPLGKQICHTQFASKSSYP